MEFVGNVCRLTPAEYYAREGEPRQKTTWRNPLNETQRVVVAGTKGIRRNGYDDIAERVTVGECPTEVVFTIEPKGTAEIPSMFDRAIHIVQNGAVIGGLAPQLIREGQTYAVDPALLPSSVTTIPRRAASNRLIED